MGCNSEDALRSRPSESCSKIPSAGRGTGSPEDIVLLDESGDSGCVLSSTEVTLVQSLMSQRAIFSYRRMCKTLQFQRAVRPVTVDTVDRDVGCRGVPVSRQVSLDVTKSAGDE